MKPTDLMPFGKHKGIPLKDVPKDYAAWLITQEGFKDKSPALYAFFTTGEDLVDPKVQKHNQETLDQRALILGMAPPEFKEWWERAYGKRLLDAGEWNYIPYLRVALAAWDECSALYRVKMPPPQEVAQPAQPVSLDKDGNPVYF